MGWWQSFRSWCYDYVIVWMTASWYRAFLVRLPTNAEVLDIGIGTATALLHNRDILVSKKINVIGLDIDNDYTSKYHSSRMAGQSYNSEGVADQDTELFGQQYFSIDEYEVYALE